MAKELQEIMFAHVNTWQAGNMTMEVFAHSIGMSRNKLEYWHRKLKRINKTKDDKLNFIEFAPFGINNKTTPVKATEKVNSSKLEIELSFPNGLCLKIYS